MGRVTNDPTLLLLLPALVLLCSCGTGGSAGGPPAPPLPLAEMEPSLSPGAQTIPGLFTTDLPLELVLAADFNQLRNDRSQESEERPAQVLVRGPDGEAVEIPIQVKTRGYFRLQKRTCSDPPLRLNFPETRPQGTVFDGQDKLKLVTHCRDLDRYEQNLLEEYLTYRMYNQLSDISFRVQLAHITYLDTSGRNDPVRRTAFFIEDEEALGERLGGRMLDVTRANPGEFVLEDLSVMYLFQFMVGNVDWGAGSGHNVKVLSKDMEYYPIPYDFDWAGLVDAPYAGPNVMTEHLHDSVRERVYWGACLSEIDYESLFARFNDAKDAMFALPWAEVGLSEGNIESAKGYLEEFYEIINSPRRAEREIIGACRQLR